MQVKSKAAGQVRGLDLGLGYLIALLVTLIVLLALVFGYLGRQAAHDKQYLTDASELRLLAETTAKDAVAAVTVNARPEVFKSLTNARDQAGKILNRLRLGDAATGLPSSPATVNASLSKVVEQWKDVRRNIDTILLNQALLESAAAFVATTNEVVPQLVTASELLIQTMKERGVGAEDLLAASGQVLLIERISSSVNRVFQGAQTSQEAAQAADIFRRSVSLFSTTLEAMRSGNPAMRISAIPDSEIQKQLREISHMLSAILDLDLLILEKFPDIFKTQDAATSISRVSHTLFEDGKQLVGAYAGLEGQRLILPWYGYVLGALALITLIVLGYKLQRDALQRLEASTEQNRRNQAAIRSLLDEMGGLAEGDLTARATVTEAFTGAIADAVNYAIDALRSLVTVINETTAQVSVAVQESQATAIQLAEASDNQAQQITEASNAANEMAASIERVSANAAESSEVALRSVAIADKGVNMVQSTIQGMDAIREQIQETSKRIKRLGESSQEIGDIVELINDIADQTNILALNAAIQAAMAGEAGRGFAVVADEVQRLAERSGSATKQIEALVRTIQADTNEAIASMETSTAGVVNGARLAQDAGEALKEIERVSVHLAELVQNISHAARQQSSASASISDTMSSIREIAAQTSVGSNETAASIGSLAGLANDLRTSVAGFKLPG
ncbi:MAG: methyl-accepting chemotaxis protein [Gammaproteobacteria bacterium]|nr:methyl-accepting chemotaxis protein [Gammaproteobacteria bacterium]